MEPGNSLEPSMGAFNGPLDLEMYGIDEDFFTGMEDFSVDDARLNRVKIHHKDNGWIQETLGGTEFREGIWFIPLAFMKMRIMWRPAMVDDAVPLCKSTDYQTGYPMVTDKDPKNNYPWGAAELNPADMSKNPENDRLVIPCDVCRLKEWGTHPVKDGAWCAQQRVVPMLFAAKGETPDQLGVMTFQQTSLGPANVFFAGISAKKIKGTTRAVPAFSTIGEITLSPRKKGDNEFQVPVFRRVGETKMEDWRSYAEQGRAVYDYLRRPPRGDEVESPEPGDTMGGAGKSGYQVPSTQTMAPPVTLPAQYVTAPAAPVQQAPVQNVQQSPIAQAAQNVQQSPPPTATEDPWQVSPAAATPASFPADDEDLPF